MRGSTKEPVAFFSNLGSCYVMRINDVPASTGYGEPVQKLFNFRDGERVVGAHGRSTPPARPRRAAGAGGHARAASACASTSDPHRELSTRAGRRFAKLGEGDEIVGVLPAGGKDDVVCVVTSDGRALLCKADEIAELADPGRGVTVIKVDDDDAVVGFGVGRRQGQGRHRSPRPTTARSSRSGPGTYDGHRRAAARGARRSSARPRSSRVVTSAELPTSPAPRRELRHA